MNWTRRILWGGVAVLCLFALVWWLNGPQGLEETAMRELAK